MQPARMLCSGGSLSAADLAVQRHQKDEWGAAPAALGWTRTVVHSCAVCGEEPEAAVQATCCSKWACYECLADAAHRTGKCPSCRVSLTVASLPERPTVVADSDENGGMPYGVAAAPVTRADMESKLDMLLRQLEELRQRDPAAKTLVFSSFRASLDWLGRKLAERGFQTATIKGSMPLAKRAAALDAFQNAPPTTIFLMSLRAGSVGLTLTAASHVVLLEPCMNPATEEQAVGRIYRMGQTRPTTVTRLIVRDSIEERIARCVAARVAGGAAAGGDDVLLRCKTAAKVKQEVAGGLRDDHAALRWDELCQLFG